MFNVFISKTILPTCFSSCLNLLWIKAAVSVVNSMLAEILTLLQKNDLQRLQWPLDGLYIGEIHLTNIHVSLCVLADGWTYNEIILLDEKKPIFVECLQAFLNCRCMNTRNGMNKINWVMTNVWWLCMMLDKIRHCKCFQHLFVAEAFDYQWPSYILHTPSKRMRSLNNLLFV